MTNYASVTISGWILSPSEIEARNKKALEDGKREYATRKFATVGDLVKALKKLDKNLPICSWDDEYSVDVIMSAAAEVVTVHCDGAYGKFVRIGG